VWVVEGVLCGGLVGWGGFLWGWGGGVTPITKRFPGITSVFNPINRKSIEVQTALISWLGKY